jgi:hypothetical protein
MTKDFRVQLLVDLQPALVQPKISKYEMELKMDKSF